MSFSYKHVTTGPFKALKYNKDHCIAHRVYNIERELEDCMARLERVYKNRHFEKTTHFSGKIFG